MGMGEEGGREAKKREGGGLWFKRGSSVVQVWFKCGFTASFQRKLGRNKTKPESPWRRG